VISMEDWITIRNLKKRNPKMGTRSIAKQLNLSRNAVRNALRSEDPPEYKRKAHINQELVHMCVNIHTIQMALQV